ncbi:hypothetical protein [Streptomyces lasalocidi]|uniref:Uncharacterized protein n=1 Tax=Streptomyces lasalocidi TaxID=324833 RepID=A0A4U5W6N9_STRLS|nr:hypothetical protein [Streptomyces lasalocidi]TKS96280.1 hypothetical protein E4U91_36935 [Streptomyces lasalocidi]
MLRHPPRPAHLVPARKGAHLAIAIAVLTLLALEPAAAGHEDRVARACGTGCGRHGQPEPERCRHDGELAPVILYSLEIAGLRVRKDGTVNPASFSHVTRCYPDSEHFQRFKPLWLRNFAEQHRVPPAVTPDPAA